MFVHGRPVADCSFSYRPIMKNKKYDIVMLPRGTFLYHTTTKGIEKDKWWEKYFPRDTTKGGIFFNQSEKHQGLHTGDTILMYKTKCDIYMLFVQNIHKQLNFAVGNDMVPHPEYKLLIQKVANDHNLKIAGYIGCNECEIFIHNEEVETCLYKKPEKEMTKIFD